MTASIAERRSTSAVATDVSVVVDRVSVSFSVYPRSSHGKRQLLSPLLRPRAVHAVTDVSFVAHRGDTIAVVGGNGSGKPTLLRAIAGLVPTRSGQVFASSRPHLLAVGVGLVPALSGWRNIDLGLLAAGCGTRDVAAMRDDVARFSGLDSRTLDRPMTTYSSGMAARLKFSIATATDARILILDEALATGDARFRAIAADRIQEMRRHAETVFLVSHSASELRSACTRALWMANGALVMQGDVNDVLDAYEGQR